MSGHNFNKLQENKSDSIVTQHAEAAYHQIFSKTAAGCGRITPDESTADSRWLLAAVSCDVMISRKSNDFCR